MSNKELLFVPAPTVSHVSPAVEAAKLLLTHDRRLSVTFCLFNMPFDPKLAQYNSSLALSSPRDPRLAFVMLPDFRPDPNSTRIELFASVVAAQEGRVREVARGIVARSAGSGSGNPLLAGFVFDMFCSALMGTAAEFGVPAYVFSPPNATFLGFVFHVQKLHDEERGHTRRIREAKGILVNTFRELESYALDSMGGDDCIPPIYPVGPVVNLEIDDVVYDDRTNEIFRWLDDQPESSVVFLCFGTMGRFGGDQVGEIARGLERSGHRFLWALRRPPSDHEHYDDLIDILPEGFSDRTVEAGRVVGWAPQKAILAHKAIGGFVSHCGWNSILESLWFAVPIAAWPMYAEQQLNAFQLVVELELATEMKLSYRMKGENDMIVSASEIERGIRRLMEEGMEKRVKWEEMSEMARKTLMVSGSSFSSTGRFVRDFLG
ncbi:unnamed protein product [Linum tenue]|uniref:Glycosyltransferase n=1 Tax=Linum tenue TaxID=586396 RepID=A0AAV0LZY9_9ROSI|nr:unnamed protein product [Linum tenue]